MERHAFKMKLKPGCEQEYKRRHDEIWPELERLLSEAGVHDYSIFLDEKNLTLFAVQKREEGYSEEGLASHPVVKKWWDYMQDLMETHPDNSPVATPLKEVFHMD
ncbi:L-rhamnose mutarotase [Fodinibius sediminis]|uniref:L-rhamnose mutarotase n=1 Tax=Fodinibius sediminis TaxID=1214077 RepID=A0A521BP38_9BACT|nr:L-rhamnose mutarotase [Fodinibius sediminis]SMO48917.1 L-rhamnose mutarotase [Fodinibius sediminis]